MNRTEATLFLRELFGSTPTDTLIDAAIDAARVVDAEGRAPADPGYVETIDQWWAAGELAGMLAIQQAQQGSVTEFSSEGSRFKTAGPDWWAVAAHYRSKSPLSTAPTGFGVVEFETEPRHIPRSSQVVVDDDWSETA